MNRKRKPCSLAGTLDHSQEPSCCDRRSGFRCEDRKGSIPATVVELEAQAHVVDAHSQFRTAGRDIPAKLISVAVATGREATARKSPGAGLEVDP